jgi:hypothetical protein
MTRSHVRPDLGNETNTIFSGGFRPNSLSNSCRNLFGFAVLLPMGLIAVIFPDL